MTGSCSSDHARTVRRRAPSRWLSSSSISRMWCRDVVQIDPLASTKRAHAGEVLDAVDVGTSLWLMGEPTASVTAATVFSPLLHLLEQVGLPQRVRFDRDPRFLGSTSMRTFRRPSYGSGTP